MPALIIGLALGFTSTSLGEPNEHARTTRRAWRVWYAENDHSLLELWAAHPFVRLAERPDGIETALLLDRLTTAWLPMFQRHTDHPVTTGRYLAVQHFDRNVPDRGSVDAFLEGARFLQDQYLEAADPASSPHAAVVALSRAAHALQDVHAHSNLPELAAATAKVVLPAETRYWPNAARHVPAGAMAWYTAEDPGLVEAALATASECLAPWGVATPCDDPSSPAVQALRGVLLLTYVAGGDPTADNLRLPRRGEPAWCGSSEEYQCYTRGVRVKAEIRAPERACAGRYADDRSFLPREVEFVHDCFAKDGPGYGVRGLTDAAQHKQQAWRRASSYAALRVAILLDVVRKKVGETKWAAMMDEAKSLTR